ncbi:MAG: hypothetical protein F2531_06285 [Actinobacteria bacterium]|uniref:Unannotated protein n=1 Tax=freshwater metagenome TaxID=449393 RepID=A0A6J6CKW8_9ZZZZ|nr:hypothetical protein [Actinomycetota bacterium]
MKLLLAIFICITSLTVSAQTDIKFNESFFGNNITYMNALNEKQKIGIKLYKSKAENSPTVIHLHGCGGVKSYAMTWVSAFQDWGYNVVVVDSFGPRWLGEACSNTTYMSKKPLERIDDLYASAEWIAAQSWNKGKPAAVGFSHGAMVLHIASSKDYSKKSKNLISSAVAFYPYCHYDVLTDWQSEWPFQMHVGKLDNWTPAWLCDGHANFQSDKFDYRSYEQAHHGWDMGVNATMYSTGVGGTVRPRTIAPNAEATKQSMENTKMWLNKFFNQ